MTTNNVSKEERTRNLRYKRPALVSMGFDTIQRDENTSLLQTIKEIDTAYEAAAADGFYGWYDSVKKYDTLLDSLPARAWLE